jgi:chlorophyll/bacteriochlorophyll a synthase
MTDPTPPQVSETVEMSPEGATPATVALNDATLNEADRSAKMRQLLGMKGAQTGDTSIWKIRLQLMKPITWIPLIWGVVCGAVSSGNFAWTLENVLIAAACMLLSGPLMAGYTQTLNEFYDREVDAINEPYRPIPSGAIPLPQVITQIWVWIDGQVMSIQLLQQLPSLGHSLLTFTLPHH